MTSPRTTLNHIRTRVFRLASFGTLAAVVAAAGCGGTDSGAADSTKPDSASGNLLQTYDSISYRATFDSATKGTIKSTDTVIVIDFGRKRTHKDTFSLRAAIRKGMKQIDAWPYGPVPLPGSIMPSKRIVAFYGYPLEKRMGALGEFLKRRPDTKDSATGKRIYGGYDTDSMLKRLDLVVKEWNEADPNTPVQPALHVVATVAQADAGRDGKYRSRIDSVVLEEVYSWAVKHNAILFVDIQIGGSTVESEVRRLMPWLIRPNVHLGLDPEFSMHYSREGLAPGKKIGIMDAKEINWAIDTLNAIVNERKLPPKVLVIHRFTRQMVSNSSKIKLTPGVQVVMDMDGWGAPWLKFDSYSAYTVLEPVQFAGFKIFFHNDSKKGDPILSAREVLHLLPRPMYIQYQ
jgi:hypothetical protein